MAYQIEAIPMNLSDNQGHSRTASLSNCDFSYCYAVNVVDRISTDVVRRAVPLRQLSFLSNCVSHHRPVTSQWCRT